TRRLRPLRDGGLGPRAAAHPRAWPRPARHHHRSRPRPRPRPRRAARRLLPRPVRRHPRIRPGRGVWRAAVRDRFPTIRDRTTGGLMIDRFRAAWRAFRMRRNGWTYYEGPAGSVWLKTSGGVTIGGDAGTLGF